MSVYVRYRKLPMKFWERGINVHADPVPMDMATHFDDEAQARERCHAQWSTDGLVNVTFHSQGEAVASYLDRESQPK